MRLPPTSPRRRGCSEPDLSLYALDIDGLRHTNRWTCCTPANAGEASPDRARYPRCQSGLLAACCAHAGYRYRSGEHLIFLEPGDHLLPGVLCRLLAIA